MAGGKGLRMGAAFPKQFLMLEGKPLLMHTLQAFYQTDPGIGLILVLPDNQREFWRSLCKEHAFQIPHKLASGGECRFDSVKNGLALAGKNGLIAIHDGVRPLVTSELIRRCYQAAHRYGAAIPVSGVIESLRHVDGDHSVAVPRDGYRLVQTPQVFMAELIQKAYQQAPGNDYTDDATVAEASGIPVRLIEGDRMNIKITEPIDLQLATFFYNLMHNKL